MKRSIPVSRADSRDPNLWRLKRKEERIGIVDLANRRTNRNIGVDPNRAGGSQMGGAEDRDENRQFAHPATYPLQIASPHSKIKNSDGVLAQLVEHHNGIVGVRGSNPLGSRISLGAQRKRRSATPEWTALF